MEDNNTMRRDSTGGILMMMKMGMMMEWEGFNVDGEPVVRVNSHTILFAINCSIHSG